MNILVLTNLLPAPILATKLRENDVLLTTAALHEQLHPDVHYTFVFVLHTSFLAPFSSKYTEHKKFLALKHYTSEGRKIEIISVPTFKWNNRLWSLYMNLAYLRSQKKLADIIKQQQIDLVHAHDLLADVGVAYNIFRWLKVPYVITIRHLGRAEKLMHHIRKFISSASAVINLGYAGKETIDALNSSSHMVSHGIDRRFLARKKIYNRADPVLRIVTVSRLLYWKNIDKVLYALRGIKEEFTYDVYGEGPHLDTLKKIVADLALQDKVVFHGHIDYDQVPETLEKYDLFVLPSYKEVFGRVYIEAMACGLPIIGAKNTGMDGHITPGEQGFLVDHTEVGELQQAIQRFINEDGLKVMMGQKAREFSLKFSWDAVIDKLDRIYRGAVSQPGR
jgi:teichuronic acid biosynthesis glycosyltransferase TuaC